MYKAFERKIAHTTIKMVGEAPTEFLRLLEFGNTLASLPLRDQYIDQVEVKIETTIRYTAKDPMRRTKDAPALIGE